MARNDKLTTRQQENIRATIAQRAGSLASQLWRHAAGDIELKPTQVKAIQILLDRVVPTLQSIDQTISTDQPELTPAEVDAMLKEYVAKLDPQDMAKLLQEDSKEDAPRLLQ